MAFRLALAMGEPDPYRMLRGMSEGLFRRWLDYSEIEPFGQMVHWRLLAANTAAQFQSQGSDANAADFMPPTRDDDEEDDS